MSGLLSTALTEVGERPHSAIVDMVSRTALRQSFSLDDRSTCGSSSLRQLFPEQSDVQVGPAGYGKLSRGLPSQGSGSRCDRAITPHLPVKIDSFIDKSSHGEESVVGCRAGGTTRSGGTAYDHAEMAVENSLGSGVMTAGHFNHYDDPDADRDDEPLVHKPLPSSPEPVTWDTAEPTFLGAGLFEMVLDEGRLPVDVDVNRHLHDRLDPRDFSAAAMTGYTVALLRQVEPYIMQPDSNALSSMPTRRAELITLLEASSLEEFEAIERAAWGLTTYSGRAERSGWDFPPVVLTARLGPVDRIDIDPRWAISKEPSYIGDGIVECADRIREQRPRFRVDTGSVHRADDELEAAVRERRSYFSRSSQ